MVHGWFWMLCLTMRNGRSFLDAASLLEWTSILLARVRRQPRLLAPAKYARPAGACEMGSRKHGQVSLDVYACDGKTAAPISRVVVARFPSNSAFSWLTKAEDSLEWADSRQVLCTMQLPIIGICRSRFNLCIMSSKATEWSFPDFGIQNQI